MLRKLICFCLVLTLAVPTLRAEARGELLLTVSDITFSVVGQSESIYAGSVPLSLITWKSENPEIVSVEDGVLTARGVGSTVIRAAMGSRVLTCTAGCLAENEEALQALPEAVLRTPVRLPPETAELDPAGYFSDAVLIGDSVTYNLMVHELTTGLLGHPLILARKNVGVFNFLNRRLNAVYRGQEYPVEEAIALSGAKKVFLLLGMNDIGYQSPEELTDRYGQLLDRIRQRNPEVQIIVQSCLPRYASRTDTGMNRKIREFNDLLGPLVLSRDCRYLDLAAYIEDHLGAMAECYTLDWDAHLNYEGCVAWMKLLRLFACTEMGG